MDKRIYEAIQFVENESSERSKKHINELIYVCKEYVKEINQLQKDVDFYKRKQEVNKKITQELVSLNDVRVTEILTKTRFF